jgi:hypothetical protein
MSIIEFKYYELDKAIDERIAESNDIRNEWGTHIFDDEGRLQNSEDFPLDRYTLLGIVQYQQEQITNLQKRLLRGSKSVGRLKVSDGINSSAIEMLLERVKDVEKYKTLIDVLTVRVAEIEKTTKGLKASDRVNSKCVNALLDRVTVLENEVIDKDLRISKLEKEVEKL